MLTGVVRCAVNGSAPIAQLAEAVDLKSIQCGFESHWGHHVKSRDIVPIGVSRLFRLFNTPILLPQAYKALT